MKASRATVKAIRGTRKMGQGFRGTAYLRVLDDDLRIMPDHYGGQKRRKGRGCLVEY